MYAYAIFGLAALGILGSLSLTILALEKRAPAEKQMKLFKPPKRHGRRRRHRDEQHATA